MALGVYPSLEAVPIRELVAAGATIALGADDPLLLGGRLAAQYAAVRRSHDLSDDQLADLAAASIRASRAAEDDKAGWIREITEWRSSAV